MTKPDLSNLENLFKSELAKSVDANEHVLIQCPHCDEGITKSQVLEKARGAKMKDANNGGKAVRGADKGAARTAASPTRPKVAKEKTNEPNPGVYDDDAKKSDDAADEDQKTTAPVVKSLDGHRVIAGSEYVRYVDTGEDARIAKSIQEGLNGYNINDRTSHNG